MDTITISRKLIKNDDLVILPRKKYKELLRLVSKGKQSYSQFDSHFEKDLNEAIKEYKAGKYFGPFHSAKEGIKFLEARRKIKK